MPHAQIERHIQECKKCREKLNDIEGMDKIAQVWKLASELEEEKVPKALIERVMTDARNVMEASDTPTSEKQSAQEVQSPFDVILRYSKNAFELIKKATNISHIMFEPVPVTVRSPDQAGEGIELTPEAGARLFYFSKVLERITAEVEVVKGAGDLFDLHVKLSETDTGKTLDGIRVTLSNLEFELKSARTRQDGIRFEDLKEESYILKVMADDLSELGRITIKIENE